MMLNHGPPLLGAWEAGRARGCGVQTLGRGSWGLPGFAQGAEVPRKGQLPQDGGCWREALSTVGTLTCKRCHGIRGQTCASESSSSSGEAWEEADLRAARGLGAWMAVGCALRAVNSAQLSSAPRLQVLQGLRILSMGAVCTRRCGRPPR